MDENKFLQLVKKDGLLGVLIALLIYFGTNLQTNQADLSKELTNIKMKLVEMESKMVDQEKVDRIIEKAIRDHEEKHLAKYHSVITNQNN